MIYAKSACTPRTRHIMQCTYPLPSSVDAADFNLYGTATICFFFAQSLLLIKFADEIRWQNEGMMPHVVYIRCAQDSVHT